MVEVKERIFPLKGGSRKPLFTILGVVLACWVAIALLEYSSYAKYIHHQSLEFTTLSQLPFLTLAFSGGWILMIGGMMLPIMAPLLLEFERATHKVKRSNLKIFFLISGFIAIWMPVGIALFVSDFGLHRAVDASPFLSENPFWIPVFLITLAGLFQFTGFKRNMLFKCRPSETSLRAECMLRCSNGRDSLLFGIRHGYFSMATCGSFMILMFAFDFSTLWSMVLFCSIMMAERYAPYVERLTDKLGLTMVGGGLVYALLATIHF